MSHPTVATRRGDRPDGRESRVTRGRSGRAALIGLGVMAVLLCVPSTTLAASSAKQLYESAIERERAARAGTPTLGQLRAVTAAYDKVVHTFPRSGYSDNALWQAAGVSLTAYENFGQTRDRTRGLRYLDLLASEYPSSSLIRQVADRRSRLIGRSAVTRRADGGPVTLRSIQRTVLPDVVRVILDLDGEVAYREERLPNPDRVFFDLANVTPSSAVLREARRWNDDAVRAIRLGRHPDNTTRVVLDLDQVSRYSVFAMERPYRLVVDFERATGNSRATAGAVTAKAPAPASALGSRAPRVVEAPAAPARNRNGKLSLARQLGLGVSRVVIDPGHGGRDPGARAGGITEADLVLDISLRLEKLLLQQPGFDVVMTRRTDAFLPLDERTALANEARADLFLSIHANAARDPKLNGVETYVLNFAQNPSAQAIAARENSASAATMGRLPDIVQAITLNNKLDESRDFAEMVQQAMVTRIRPHHRGVRDLGVKQAPFVVLIGAGMPSILAEVSFLTNPQDAKLLKDGAHRQRLAEALLDGIIRYQGSLKSVTTVALQ